MTASQDLRNALKGFHLDNPGATWEEIREAIRSFAIEALEADHSGDPMQQYGMVYSGLRSELTGHAMTASMTAVQARGIDTATKALRAAESRLSGNLGPLNGIIQDLSEPQGSLSEPIRSPANKSPSLSLSVNAKHPKGSLESHLESPERLTFLSIATAYVKEHRDNIQASTLKNLEASLRVLSVALADTNMMTHSRDDMTTLKETLGTTRANSTVNKLLTILLTVCEWAVNTGMIDRHYAKGLKIRKDADSSRKAFTEAQVVTIMAQATEETTEASLLIQLGTLTGARLAELTGLTKGDFKEVAGVSVIDINTNHSHKSLKNKQSHRLVPLVEAMGSDLGALFELVEALPTDDSRLFPNDASLGRTVNAKLRQFHGMTTDKALTFHSLRHSMATAFKAKGLSLDHAQAILGHSSRTITFDLYGRGAGVDLKGLKESLTTALTVTQEVTQ